MGTHQMLLLTGSGKESANVGVQAFKGVESMFWKQVSAQLNELSKIYWFVH